MNRKKKILFVDDDPVILQGFRRMLRKMRNEWDTDFAESGQQALEIMGEDPMDMVVSDMRMPGMDGAQLLKEVKNNFPDTIRIILSGQADEHGFLQAASFMHQFLSKPCDFQLLKSTVDRAFSLQKLLSSKDLEKLVSRIESIPILPELYSELTEELNSEEYSLENVGKIISKDIGMSAKILQLANSAFFGSSQKVLTVEHAVQILGMDMIQSLVLSYQIFSKFEQNKLTDLSLDKIWNHSMTVRKYAVNIAEAEDTSEAFKSYVITGAMLHDIGKILIAYYLPDKYQEVLSFAQANSVQICQAEQSILNITHDQLSAYLLGLWGFPDPLVEAVAYHHFPSQSECQTLTPLVAIHVANVLAHEIDGDQNDRRSSELDENYIKKIGLLDRVPVWREICQGNTSEYTDK